MLSTEEIKEMKLFEKVETIFRKGNADREFAEKIHDVIINRINENKASYYKPKDSDSSFFLQDRNVRLFNIEYCEENEKNHFYPISIATKDLIGKLIKESLKDIGLDVKATSICIDKDYYSNLILRYAIEINTDSFKKD